jgi:hypothetical protein
MRSARLLGVAAALVAAAGAAWAGGCGGGGWGCPNKCPLAQKAGECRSYGAECPAVQKGIAGLVIQNLEKI